MRRVALACSSIAIVALASCFQDPGPPPGDDDIGDASGSDTNGTTGESTGESESSDHATESDSTGHPQETTDSDTETTESTTDTSETGGQIVGTWEPCGPEMTCDGGGVCLISPFGWFVFNICAPQGCNLGGDCPNPLPNIGLDSYCFEDACMVQCESSLQCGDGLVCKNGSCWYNLFWGPCITANSCPMGSACSSDESVSACLPLCMEDSDCPPVPPEASSPVCTNGRCEIPCDNLGGCPDGMICVNNFCRYPGLEP
jgi:hypothetical protein